MVFGRRKARPPDPVGDLDPATVPARYRPPVVDALAARQRFDELVATLRPGPLQDRLRDLRGRVDAGVLAVWNSTARAVDLERVIDTLGPERIAEELKRARRDGADAAIVDALSARFASTQRLLNTLEDLHEHLPVVEARLGPRSPAPPSWRSPHRPRRAAPRSPPSKRSSTR